MPTIPPILPVPVMELPKPVTLEIQPLLLDATAPAFSPVKTEE